jgi:hypothetical protein
VKPRITVDMTCFLVCTSQFHLFCKEFWQPCASPLHHCTCMGMCNIILEVP